MNPPATRRELTVDELVDRFFDELDELAEQRPSASLTELVDACPTVREQVAARPELLAALAERFQAIRAITAVFALGDQRPVDAPNVPGFEVLGILGHGGMGVVYLARQLSLRRDVALKLLLGGRFANPRARERFRHEAEIAARLQHPRIAQIYDHGEFEGLPFLAQELVRGGSLAERIAGQPVAPREAAQLVVALAEGVHYAHQFGIVHRDLKPSNVLLTETGEPKIVDFGLAKALGDDSGLTRTGDAPGTPNYMPPEQVTGAAVGPHTDVYGLGAILFELLTGRPPFCGRSSAPRTTQSG